MFERFGKDVRAAVVRAAETEAPELGSRTLEAEHLLLALATQPGPVGRLLNDSGLNREALGAALEAEMRRSLAAVGVDARELGPAALPAPAHREPRMAASAKRALERALEIAVARKDRRIGAAHLLVGILRPDLGTVSRALEAGERDRVALLSRAEALLG